MKKYRFLSIIPLLLFLIFAICAFVTLVSGIKTVNTLSSVGDDNRILRTALQYISTRYHSASPDCVFVHEFEEIPPSQYRRKLMGYVI